MSERTARTVLFQGLALLCAIPALFFTVYGVLLIYAVITFDGEGSLGTVGLYIAALLYPLLAFFFTGCTVIAWRRSRRLQGTGHASRTPG